MLTPVPLVEAARNLNTAHILNVHELDRRTRSGIPTAGRSLTATALKRSRLTSCPCRTESLLFAVLSKRQKPTGEIHV